MHFVFPPSWSLPDSAVTPEPVYLARRQFLRTLGLGLAAGALAPMKFLAATAGLPSKPNPAYRLNELTLTKENAILGYNNFIEFSFQKEGPSIEANKGWKT